jgi:hypothetical protein
MATARVGETVDAPLERGVGAQEVGLEGVGGGRGGGGTGADDGHHHEQTPQRRAA